MRAKFLLMPVLAMAGLAACAATLNGEATLPPASDAEAQAGQCRPEAVTALVGQVLPSEARVKEITGATIVRVAGPEDMLTQDFRVERATIIVDPQSKTILRAGCN